MTALDSGTPELLGRRKPVASGTSASFTLARVDGKVAEEMSV